MSQVLTGLDEEYAEAAQKTSDKNPGSLRKAETVALTVENFALAQK
jgi:hypothetical protein